MPLHAVHYSNWFLKGSDFFSEAFKITSAVRSIIRSLTKSLGETSTAQRFSGVLPHISSAVGLKQFSHDGWVGLAEVWQWDSAEIAGGGVVVGEHKHLFYHLSARQETVWKSCFWPQTFPQLHKVCLTRTFRINNVHPQTICNLTWFQFHRLCSLCKTLSIQQAILLLSMHLCVW